MKRNWKNVVVMCMAVVLAVGVTGCKKKPIDTGIKPPETTVNNGMVDPGLESITFIESGLQAVYFDYDSSALRQDQMDTLKTNAAAIKNNPSKTYQIQGHCDERGTQEYNLALGERRALAVREHLMKLGVSGDRMVTVSYGEENPKVAGSSEAAWSKNRRGEFFVSK